jgi:hypothetical protein
VVHPLKKAAPGAVGRLAGSLPVPAMLRSI